MQIKPIKKVCAVTGSRAEFGLLAPVLEALYSDEAIELQLIVTGTHLIDRFGHTIDEIHDLNLPITRVLSVDLPDDAPSTILKAMGQALNQYADLFVELAPDMLLLLGDRSEILPAAEAALHLNIPIAHIGGGEETTGAIDNSIRHSVSHMSSLHFVAAEAYAERLISMGISPQSVFNVGSLGVENILSKPRRSFEEVHAELGLPNGRPLFLITYHPVTRDANMSLKGSKALLQALETFPDAALIFTGVNADAGRDELDRLFKNFVLAHKNRAFIAESLGVSNYLSVMSKADIVIGNSSSGLFEAPAMHVPSVNIGNRQTGRLKAASVIDCNEESKDIIAACEKALSPAFQKMTRDMEIPFNGKNVTQQIVSQFKKHDVSNFHKGQI